MQRLSRMSLVVFPLNFFLFGCDEETHDFQRQDDAYRLEIDSSGSLQNPAWSPDSGSLLLTRFVRAYNAEPADLLVYGLEDGAVTTLVSDGGCNVNLPGAAWNDTTQQIVFSSSRDPHDEIYTIASNGVPGDEIMITQRANDVAYEPSFSPDGEWVVLESHPLDVEGNGVITKFKIDGTAGYQPLTGADEDCRQPNWAPDGSHVLYQKFTDGQWDIWVMDSNGANVTRVTSGPGDKTDASFSPGGRWIVYSSNEEALEFANIFIIPVEGGDSIRVTSHDGYDGAPSWSPDGTKIAFESYPGDPDDSAGTSLWVIDAPDVLSK